MSWWRHERYGSPDADTPLARSGHRHEEATLGDPTPAELVAAAGCGDRDAWDTLVERYAGLVWSVARAHGLDPTDAADVSQTTWLRLVEYLHRLREPERIGSWLATTARHESRRVLRRSAREISVEEPYTTRDEADEASPEPSPEAVALASERRAHLAAAFAALSPRCRDLLRVLAATPPPSYAEASDALGVPIGSIGPTRARCLEHLRRLATRDAGSWAGSWDARETQRG
ncbi:MAG: RNA polymerase sigma factor [Streptosporangiaceae bacterium]